MGWFFKSDYEKEMDKQTASNEAASRSERIRENERREYEKSKMPGKFRDSDDHQGYDS